MYRLFVISLLVLAVCAPLRAQQSTPPQAGLIEGRVVDAATGEPLPGARVIVTGSASEMATNRDGAFRLSNVAAGEQTVVVTYLGRRDETATVQVTAGTASTLEVQMSVAAFETTVTVQADLITDANARALNQQRTAPNITNVISADQIGAFPDRNAAETTQRIPGISITKDQGEGRYVNVRGTEPRLNSMMIDGERIPSPDPLLRQVAIDVVPSELLQSIEVSKALTPDMDGDSIGGSVNLVMKHAPDRFRLFGSAGGGFNHLLSSKAQSNVSATAGRRFNAGKLGVIVSASSSATNRGNQDMEVTYTPTLALNELNPRWYQVTRRRWGLSGAMDVKASGNSSFTIRGLFNRFIDDHENRQRLRLQVANGRIDRELRDRTHIERISSLAFTGQTLVHNATTIDYQLRGAYSDQTDPLTMTTTFRETRVTFAPNVTSTSIDPDNVQANPLNDNVNNYNFNAQLRATNFAKDRDGVGSVNVRTPLTSSPDVTSFLKFGFKYRNKRRGRDRNETNYTTTTALKMTNYLETGFDLPPYLDGRYDLTPYISQALVSNILGSATFTGVFNHARDAENFDGTEQVASTYAMAEIYVGSKLFLLPGVRLEYTNEDFVGRNVRFDPKGNWLGSDPLAATSSYAVPLPDFHVRYAATPNTNVRFAVTRSLARPNFYDAVPYRAQDDSALTVAMGTAGLRPTKSWNADAAVEHYFKSVGVVSAGAFYKHLSDYIYTYTQQQQINGAQYLVTQPLNGDAATLAGLEVAVQNRLRFLPSPLNGIGIYANYTYTTSTARFPSHSGDATLPGQSKNVGNIAASYEKGGFDGRVSVAFHGSYLDTVGADNTQDRFYDKNSQLDVTLLQKVTRDARVYLNLLNLNNALLRYYQGTPDRVQQEEHYSWWAEFGVKLAF
ncbi:MAG: TonB-dependent receptor [Acidobacteriota bacterium]